MIIQTPNWVKHAIFYQIFPDSFAHRVPPHQNFLLNIPLDDWDAKPTVKRYKGGNLWGAIDKLDYLQDLGITAIYFTPIFQSACNHRYHTHDYYTVDPMLGGNEAFEQFLETAHKRNFKVILDGVFNHASRGFFFFNDILEHGPDSPWLDWFIVKGWPVSAYDGSRPANYESWADIRSLPQFNHANPAVREYLMQVAEYWLKKGIDGWRLDVPYCIKVPGFWQEFRQRVKAINPDAYIVGEIFDNASQWLDGTQFDGVMNYPFGRLTIAFVVGDRLVKKHIRGGYEPTPALDAPGYAAEINQLLERYPWEIQLTQLNLLDSHDVARLITMAGGDRASVELAALLLFTFPGTPNIFYGDEIGLEGGHEPDCRTGFPTEDQWDQDILKLYRKLIQLRKTCPPLRTGDYQTLFAQGNTYIFARILAECSIIVAINGGDESVQVCVRNEDARSSKAVEQIFTTKPSKKLYGTGEAIWTDDLPATLNLSLIPRSGMILT